MNLPKKYSEAEFETIFRTLSQERLQDEEFKVLVRGRIDYAALQYQRRRDAFDEHRRRHEKERQLLADIEAIERLLNFDLVRLWESCWRDASDKEVFELGASMVERTSVSTILWAKPPYSEITRRTLQSMRDHLVGNLDYVDPWAITNRGLPEEEHVPKPAKNDKRPERQFVEALLNVYAGVLQIDVQEVPIGNDSKTNDFLRFARTCVDPINKQAFSDFAIRDHARAIRKAAGSG